MSVEDRLKELHVILLGLLSIVGAVFLIFLSGILLKGISETLTIEAKEKEAQIMQINCESKEEK